MVKLPADQQIEAVSRKLVELNPGFDGQLTNTDGKGTPRIEMGVVAEIGFVTNNVLDISPVRALSELQALNCSGSGSPHAKFSDLSPLKGMQLVGLTCNFTHVSDLTPLQGMQLVWLHCIATDISDLTPLKGMNLNGLALDESPNLADLSPLKGMKLRGLWCGGSKVADLSPLEGMNLTTLSCSNSRVSNLFPVKDMKLEFLICHNTHIDDLSMLKGMPLKRLDFDFKPERDIELIRSLKTLEIIRAKPAAEFWKEVEQQKGNTPGP